MEEQSEECWWSWVAWRELVVAMEGNSTLPFIGRRSSSSSRLQPPTINGGDCGWQLAGVGVQRGVAEMTAELMMRVTRQRGWHAWGTIDFVDL